MDFDSDFKTTKTATNAGTHIWRILITLMVAYLLASSFYQYAVSDGTSTSYSNHNLLSRLNTLEHNFKALNRSFYKLTNCISCTDEVLYVTNINSSGAITVYNSTGGFYFNIVNYTIDLGVDFAVQQAQIDALQEEVANITAQSLIPPHSIRLSANDLELISGTLPNSSIIQFENGGDYSFDYDNEVVFDTSNASFVGMKKRALVRVTAGIYFAGNGTEPQILCMMMVNFSSAFFTVPVPMAFTLDSVNVTSIGFPFEELGASESPTMFVAEPGWQLNIQCSIAQPSPMIIVPTSFLLVEAVHVF